MINNIKGIGLIKTPSTPSLLQISLPILAPCLIFYLGAKKRIPSFIALVKRKLNFPQLSTQMWWILLIHVTALFTGVKHAWIITKKANGAEKKTLMVKSDIEIYTHKKKNIRKSQKGKWSWKRKILTVKSDIEIYTHTNKDKYKNLNKETKMWLVYGV